MLQKAGDILPDAHVGQRRLLLMSDERGTEHSASLRHAADKHSTAAVGAGVRRCAGE